MESTEEGLATILEEPDNVAHGRETKSDFAAIIVQRKNNNIQILSVDNQPLIFRWDGDDKSLGTKALREFAPNNFGTWVRFNLVKKHVLSESRTTEEAKNRFVMYLKSDDWPAVSKTYQKESVTTNVQGQLTWSDYPEKDFFPTKATVRSSIETRKLMQNLAVGAVAAATAGGLAFGTYKAVGHKKFVEGAESAIQFGTAWQAAKERRDEQKQNKGLRSSYEDDADFEALMSGRSSPVRKNDDEEDTVAAARRRIQSSSPPRSPSPSVSPSVSPSTSPFSRPRSTTSAFGGNRSTPAMFLEESPEELSDIDDSDINFD